MLEKLADKIIGPLSLRGAFQIIGSLAAICVVGARFGFGRMFIPDGLSGQAFLAIQSRPLAIPYRVLDFLSLPTGWVARTATYLAANESRATVIGRVATVVGLLATIQLTPDEDRNPVPAPSLQASAWWVCMAVAMQVSHVRSVGDNQPWFLIIWLILWWAICEIRARVSGSRHKGRLGLDLVQLSAAALYVFLMVVPVIFDGHPAQIKDGQ